MSFSERHSVLFVEMYVTSLLTSFPALSVYPRVEISRSASEIDDRFYLPNETVTKC